MDGYCAEQWVSAPAQGRRGGLRKTPEVFIELWLSQGEAGPGGSGCLDSKKQIVSKKQEGRLKWGLDLATGQPWPEQLWFCVVGEKPHCHRRNLYER